ncbi:ATP-binding protein [Shouchella patagoniensis]|uniref:ATP-binding protein n=1 Tax=Shouchella patagoniensis TaxID=228576 RepID=UPI000994CE23|nr:sensor histidine kinase [Shouchella patagoniensis]
MGKKRSLEKKFMIYITCLITLIMLLVTAVYLYLEREQARQLIGEQALTTALAISEIPDVKKALTQGGNVAEVRLLTERIRESSGAEYIVIGDAEGVRLTHPDPLEIGRPMVGGDNDEALLYGNSYISLADGSLGTSVRGKTPVFNEEDEVVGVVSVGFMIDYINSIFQQGFFAFLIWLSLIFLLGLIGSRVLARSIRNDTFGLEPYQIARLYKERQAVLESVKEGLIATDQHGMVTLVNQSAKEMLFLDDEVIGKPVEVALPKSEMADVLKDQERTGPHEAIFQDKRLIIHYQTIEEGGVYGGKVASFQNRSELNELINALSEMQQYSQDLRAQTHEYTNKLYAISGWLQLGYTQKAIEFIHQETGSQNRDGKVLFDQIKDPTIQAVLVGKRSKASEKKIDFHVDLESSVTSIWSQSATGPLVTIIGNIIDNAFEAVIAVSKPYVSLFMTDVGNELIIEIADNGHGIDERIADRIFEQGFSTKADDKRGFGLALTIAALKELNGSLEIEGNIPQGTIVSLYIPKNQEVV